MMRGRLKDGVPGALESAEWTIEAAGGLGVESSGRGWEIWLDQLGDGTRIDTFSSAAGGIRV